MSEERKTTAKDFFLHLGLIVSLYSSVTSLLVFIFSVINKIFPDVSYYSYYSSQTSITSSLSVLIVMFPIFIYVSRINYKNIDATPEKKNTWVRRWAIYLTLFLLGLSLAITLITLINTFLSGEITMRFLLKVLAVVVVAAGSFWFYLKDAKGDFVGRKKTRLFVSKIVSTLVVVAIVAGILIVGTPSEQRAQILDNTRVSDLTSIQSQVLEYKRTNGSLPSSLSELEDPLTYFSLPKDPETQENYGYSIIDENTFELCATFSTSVEKGESSTKSRNLDPYFEDQSQFWSHKEGYQCFERYIDPNKFPTYDR